MSREKERCQDYPIKYEFFFISIHKPLASIRFTPITHALAVTVEPFKLSLL